MGGEGGGVGGSEGSCVWVVRKVVWRWCGR